MSHEYEVENPAEVPMAINEAVADCHDIDVLEIDQPLGQVIDVDSLETLFWPTGRFYSDPKGVLTFDYYGCRITVASDGSVRATRKTDLEGRRSG